MGRGDRAGWRDIVEPVEDRAGRKAGPDRGLHPRNAPALLIDHDEQVVTAMERSQIVGERAHLRPIDDIAFEQDVSRRLSLGKEGAFVRGEGFAGQAENDGFHARISSVDHRACRSANDGPAITGGAAGHAFPVS